jgi:hypothetical protein
MFSKRQSYASKDLSLGGSICAPKPIHRIFYDVRFLAKIVLAES